jgi:hypothetical protein
MQSVVFDIETYPNTFTLCALDAESDSGGVFEISPRRDDREAMFRWLFWLSQNRIEMIGFNNIGFDYPVIHAMMNNPTGATADFAYRKAMSIIQGQNNDRFGSIIWPNERYIPQIDLFKIMHFDNKARSTSLKSLEFAMRSASVEDLPFPVGTMLTAEQIDTLIAYNGHDVTETKAFYHKVKDKIEFRRTLTAKYERDFMNHNDTKIGKDYFIMQLGDDVCFTRDANGKRAPKQTPRPSIALGEVIFPYVRFAHPEFNRILDWFRAQVITETKGVFEDVNCVVDGFRFDFGTGGLHGSLTNVVVEEDEDHMILDADVTSMYPSLGIVNRIYPEHLGERFCDIYTDIKNQRVSFAKGTPENEMLKLALNGVYGDSNNKYSPFYDPKYTMAITINGQLSICMLAEQLMAIPGLQLIQVNTDGLTCRFPRKMEPMVRYVYASWEKQTGLDLEYAQYRKMVIKDVNNYVAVTTKNKAKCIGTYVPYDSSGLAEHQKNAKGWHQDQSAMIIPKAAVEHIVHGADPEQFIRSHTDPFDFMCRAKAPRGSELFVGGNKVSRTIRYYIARQGGPLLKVSPAKEGEVEGWYKRRNGVSVADYQAWHAAWGNTWNPEIHTGNKSIYETRHLGLETGWNVALCNRAEHFVWSNVNYDYYVNEVKKLLTML